MSTSKPATRLMATPWTACFDAKPCPALTGVRTLSEQFNAKLAEITHLLHGELDAARTRELADDMRAGTIPAFPPDALRAPVQPIQA